MNGDVANLVIEQLRAIRGKVDKIDNGLGDLRQRVCSIERHLADRQNQLANLRRDMANIHQRLDRQGDRLDRIGRRLEFTDTPA